MCAFLLVQVCANYPSVVHVSTDEKLVDGFNWDCTPFHVLLMSLLSWPSPVELLLSEVLMPLLMPEFTRVRFPSAAKD